MPEDFSDYPMFLWGVLDECFQCSPKSLCKSKGIPTEKVIKARWVLTWKKSSDPDDRTKTPKARLVLVGWQDPDLGKIQTDSPTLRKETKHLILSLCAAKRWRIWGADIKTAFLSGDPSSRDKPPKEIKEWMSLADDDLYRLEGGIRFG